MMEICNKTIWKFIIVGTMLLRGMLSGITVNDNLVLGLLGTVASILNIIGMVKYISWTLKRESSGAVLGHSNPIIFYPLLIVSIAVAFMGFTPVGSGTPQIINNILRLAMWFIILFLPPKN